MSIKNDMLRDYAKRLGIYDSEAIKKSEEFLLLIKLKDAKLNDTSKLVLCIDCAANVSDIDFDHKRAVQLSGLKEKDYLRQKELIEKWLNLRKTLTLADLCAQFEINDVHKNDAARLVDEYKRMRALSHDEDQVNISAMAIYQSLKLRKVSSKVKSNLMHISNLRRKDWKQFEEEWDKWIEKSAPLRDKRNRDTNLDIQTNSDVETMDQRQNNDNGNRIENEEQPYEEWRDSILKRAKEMLNGNNSIQV